MKCPHCDSDLEGGDKGAPRSPEQLRRYFAEIRAKFHHWPETHEVQFSNISEFRAWLQMKAGHREIGAKIPLTGMSKERAILLAQAAIRGSGSYSAAVIHNDTLVIFNPKSIAFRNMAHQAFCQLNDEVDEVFNAETDLDAEKCLAEYKEMV